MSPMEQFDALMSEIHEEDAAICRAAEAFGLELDGQMPSSASLTEQLALHARNRARQAVLIARKEANDARFSALQASLRRG